MVCRPTVVITLVYSIALVAACGGESAEMPPADAQKSVEPPAALDYLALDTLIDSAQTADDFSNAFIECAKLEAAVAASGIGELTEDETYREHCRRRPVHARARMALGGSTPARMSPHCLAAAKGLEVLSREGIDKAESDVLLAEVTKVCGM